MCLHTRRQNTPTRSTTTKTRNKSRLQTRPNTTNPIQYDTIRKQTRQTTRNTKQPKHINRPPTNNNRNQTTTTRQNNRTKLQQNNDNNQHRWFILNWINHTPQLPTHLKKKSPTIK